MTVLPRRPGSAPDVLLGVRQWGQSAGRATASAPAPLRSCEVRPRLSLPPNSPSLSSCPAWPCMLPPLKFHYASTKECMGAPLWQVVKIVVISGW